METTVQKTVNKTIHHVYENPNQLQGLRYMDIFMYITLLYQLKDSSYNVQISKSKLCKLTRLQQIQVDVCLENLEKRGLILFSYTHVNGEQIIRSIDDIDKKLKTTWSENEYFVGVLFEDLGCIKVINEEFALQCKTMGVLNSIVFNTPYKKTEIEKLGITQEEIESYRSMVL